MSKTKEYYHDVINAEISDDDYFQLMSEKEWQEAVEAEEERLKEMFGNGVYAKLKFGEFLNKNS